MSINRLIAIGLAASVLMTAATGCGKATNTGSTAANAGSTTPNDAGSVTSSETPIEEPSPSPGKEEVNDSSNETSDSAAYTKEKQLQSPPSQIGKRVSGILSMSTRTSA